MTSAIYEFADTIDESFPVAGQDNNSQGFRDNFSSIKDGLNAAADEISSLQSGSAKLFDNNNEAVVNNFNGSRIDNAVINALSSLVKPNADSAINYAEGEYQKITVSSNLTVNMSGWPDFDDVCSKLTLELKSDSVSVSTIGFSSVSSTNSSSSFKKNWSGSLQLDPGTTKVVEVWTSNKGQEVFLSLKGTYS